MIHGLLFPVVLVAGLLLPGWLLARILRTPVGPAGWFLGSAGMLMHLVVLGDAVGLPLRLAPLAAVLAALLAFLAALAVRAGSRGTDHGAGSVAPRPALAGFASAPGWSVLPVALGLGAIAVRATLEPLSGFDTVFRWDFLARQMVTLGRLDFYPPAAAEDFLHYGWCDGIAPLVATLYFWTYLGLGRVEALATAPVVVGQAVLLFALVWECAVAMGGRAAGRWALGVLAASALLLWGVAAGQETGLTALSLLATLAYAGRHRAEPHAAWPVWAGLAAGVGALAREYGLAFAAVGLLALRWHGARRRALVAFAAAFAAMALPWYLLAWIRTGHPLFPHALGGLFPSPARHQEYMRSVSEAQDLLRDPAAPGLVGAALLVLAIIPLGLGLLGGWAQFRRHGAWLLGLLGVVGLWWLSIGQTSGGYVYSLRVLTPALALGAVLGGAWLARWSNRRFVALAAGGLMLAAGDAAFRSLHLPVDAGVTWWKERPLAWREFSQLARRWYELPVWAAIAEAAEGRAVLVTDPVAYVNLVRRGVRAVPVFSPAADPAFGPAREPAATAAALRARGFRFVFVTQGNPVQDRWLQRHAFFAALARGPAAARGRLYSVHDLYAADQLAALGADPPAAPPPGPR